MLLYTIKRFFLAILVALTVSVITFSLNQISGDPAIAMAGETASDADIEYIRQLYGFDRPIYEQYLSWVGGALQGDLGQSLYFKIPVTDLLMERLPVSMTLGICAISFAILLSVPLGVVAAMRPNSWIDRFALGLSVVGQAMPSFWLALMLVVLLGVMDPILPMTGSDSWQHFVMPTVVLGYYATPAIMRLTRTGMLEVLGSDSYRTLGAYGLTREGMMAYFEHYVRDAEDYRNPLVVPLLADLKGLPPSFVYAAGLDVLRDDAIALDAALRSAGVPGRLEVFEGVPHAFLSLTRTVAKAHKLIEACARDLTETLQKVV